MSFTLKKMEENLFLEKRIEILKSWKTDSKLDLEEIIKFHNFLPSYKNFAKKIEQFKKEKKISTQASAGTTLIDEQLKVLSSLSEEERVDFLSVVVDSFTKENKFENCERAVEESKITNKSVLNGFPLVNYGVKEARKLINGLAVPLQLKHGSTKPEFLVEMAIASGITSIEGGGISHNIPFSKSVSLIESIENWKYVDRLIGFYEEHGISIHRETNAILTATLVPPAISNVIQILECILAVEQGVKNISLVCTQYGNLIQDIASLEALKEDTEFYLKKMGFKNINLSTVFFEWVGGFPNNSIKSYGTISYGALAGVLSKADRIFIKNPEDYSSNYLNISPIDAIDLTKSILKIMNSQTVGNYSEVNVEKEQIKKEVKMIMNKIEDLAEGDLTKAIVRAFELGVVDIPFAPSKYNLGKMMPARDSEGMIRYLDIGNLPFDDEVRNFHRKKIEMRAKREEREINFQMTVDDIFSISNGELISCKKKK